MTDHAPEPHYVLSHHPFMGSLRLHTFRPHTTLIKLEGLENGLIAPENTKVILVENDKIRFKPVGENVDAKLLENLLAKIYPGDLSLTPSGGENATLTADLQVTDNDGTAMLLTDTQVTRLEDNVIELPEDTKLQLVNQTSAEIGVDNKIKLEKELSWVLPLGWGDNGAIDPPDDNTGQRFVALETKNTNTDWDVSPGDSVLLWNESPYENRIVFPAGTVLEIGKPNTVTIPENTKVIRAAGKNAKMVPDTATEAENLPNNWMQSSDTDQITWEGIGENSIAPDGSLGFPFSMTSASGGGSYTLRVKTWDAAGDAEVSTIELEVDNVAPTVEDITISKEWAGENEDVEIEVTFSETVTRFDNLLVHENNATENATIEDLSSNADNTVWTGTYTTSDNIERDGVATVYVVGSKFEDSVGNLGVGDRATFRIDRVAPPAPSLDEISDLWTSSPTNDSTWLLEDNAEDNYCGTVSGMEGLTVEIIVNGNAVGSETSDVGGYWAHSLSLTEGEHRVGIQIVDLAGNVGTENADNVIYDATPPTITSGTIADKTLEGDVRINDNTPVITLSISDAVIGIENEAFTASDNTGYSVQLQKANGDQIEDNLMNALAHDNNSLDFENTWDTELVDNTYNLYIVAGDSLQMDNAVFSFTVDTEPPTEPSEFQGIGADTSRANAAELLNQERIIIEGETDANATVTVFVNDSEAATTTADAHGEWSTEVSLSEGMNKIEVTATDVAGNETSKQLYGYVNLTIDRTPPTVSITAPEDGMTTGKLSVVLEASLEDDTSAPKGLTVLVRSPAYTIPEQEVTVSSTGELEMGVPLSEGLNTITVVAKDEAGNVNTASVTVTRTVTPWAIYAAIVAVIAIIIAVIAVLRRGMGSEGSLGRRRSGL